MAEQGTSAESKGTINEVISRVRLRTSTGFEAIQGLAGRTSQQRYRRTLSDVSLIRPALAHQPSAKDVFFAHRDSRHVDDLTEKKNEYEQAGVPEYWVMDVADRTVFVFRIEQGYTALGAKSSGIL